jgi:hypothetical protein
MLLSSKGYLSHLSEGTKAFLGGGGIPPPWSRGRRGTTPHPPPWAEEFPAVQRTYSERLRGSGNSLHGKASGRINYHAPSEKCTTHGEESDQLPRTEINRRPRHTGVAEEAGALRLGPTVYDLCSFRLKDRSVTSVNVHRVFVRGGSIQTPSARGRRGTTPQPPPGAEQCPAAQRT